MVKQYNLNKTKKVNEVIICHSCGKSIVKTTYNKSFCSTKCKDNYWNNIDDNKRRKKNAYYYSMLDNSARAKGFKNYNQMLQYNVENSLGNEGDSFACEVSICEICGLRADICQCDFYLNID